MNFLDFRPLGSGRFSADVRPLRAVWRALVAIFGPVSVTSSSGRSSKPVSVTRIFVFQQSEEKRVDKLISGVLPKALLSVDGPPACAGPAAGEEASCLRQVMRAWLRLREARGAERWELQPEKSVKFLDFSASGVGKVFGRFSVALVSIFGPV